MVRASRVLVPPLGRPGGSGASGVSTYVGEVIGLPVGPADLGSDREVAFGLGSGVTPADIAGDGLALLLMGPVIGAATRRTRIRSSSTHEALAGVDTNSTS